ncbi:MAG: phospho-N-acetylmuramoyl-pentapeptide-transferase [Candidatus Omnitrophota bacterium]
MAAMTAFLISIIFGPAVIRLIAKFNLRENIRPQSESHRLHELQHKKQGTPTMGGVLILLSIFVSVLLWADIFNRYIILVSLATIWLGVTGFIDDYLKHIKKQSKGLAALTKIASQVLLGLILGILIYLHPDSSTRLDIPFFKDIFWDLGIFYIFFVVLVISGSSNAVNLTDGLDGLAAGIVVMVALAFTVLSYVTGNIKLSSYLLVPYISGSGELAVFCSSLIGAGLGFLWFNAYPASIFMGDVGSLALGGAIGTVAILIKKELLLLVVGGIFVLEALSVILQVFSFKLTKKRIFKIAPLHHHFQFLDWPENKVIVRFWIIAGLLALLTLVTLKIR